jgi:glycosyltransferase involved in cell wall biosynthesis
MKILYGITKSNFGGAQRYVFDLARESKKAGHEVSVLCGGEGVLVKRLQEENIRVITFPHLKRDISLLDEARSLNFILLTLRNERPDVFHTNSSKLGGLGNFTARLAGIKKIVFTSHGWAFNEKRPFWQKVLIKFFSWLTIFFSHQTICVSDKTREQIERWPLVKNKLKVIHNGIDHFPTLSREEARKELGVNDSTLLIGSLAELHHIKGLDILLEAWQKFVKNHDAKLVIFGEGEERKNLVHLAEVLEIKGSVNFKGFVEDARRFLPALDIFILPSRSENLPYSVLEAGLVGLPSIATRVGGIPEIIETGVSGALVEPESPREILSTLILFSEDQTLRERVGSALKEKVQSEFTLEKMARDTIGLYAGS